VKFVFLNGQLVPAESATVSIFDRSFLYGDGLFETLRVSAGQPQRWDDHWSRFSGGAKVLRISLEYDSAALRKQVDKLLEANESPEAVLRIQLSRGAGPRGYSPREAKSPALVMSTHPLAAAPAAWKLATTSFRLPPLSPLSAFKTSNKLFNVLAKAEAEEKEADEGLLLTDGDHVCEGTSSNLFWIQLQTVCTPPEQAGILPGITRAAVLRACEQLEIPVRQTTTRPDTLFQSAGAFMTLSTFGIVEAITLDGQELARSPLTARLREHLAAEK
jgi:aminodeoxychorismate lyase